MTPFVSGPLRQGPGFARYIHSRPELRHIRTRHKAAEDRAWLQSLQKTRMVQETTIMNHARR
jgi:hypothetical protein